MPQVQKPEVRARILEAAITAFARRGFTAATMSEIAEGAGMAVANLYRYYSSKEDLFDAAVPRDLALRFDQLLERSVHAHAQLAGLQRRADETAAGELLEFWIRHRLQVVILLDRAQGSVHESFAERFVERLLALSLAEIKSAHPGVAIPREARLVLRQIFENTRRMIAVLLEAHSEDASIRRAVAAFRSYQVAGLAAFAQKLAKA